MCSQEAVFLYREELVALDRWAAEHVGLPTLLLMENAGRNAADAAGLMLEDPDMERVAVLAGAGNNGGDGFVVARHLVVRQIDVTVFLLAPRERISGDAEVNLNALERLGAAVEEAAGKSAAELEESWKKYDLLVDALGGTGISGPLRDDLAEAVKAANATGKPILALDIPTGLDCDTGRADGAAIKASMTITFAAMKMGFENPASQEHTGQVSVGDIGIPVEAWQAGKVK